MIAADKQLSSALVVPRWSPTPPVDEHTKNIIIECANFNMYSIRRTSMSLVYLRTHARFTTTSAKAPTRTWVKI